MILLVATSREYRSLDPWSRHADDQLVWWLERRARIEADCAGRGVAVIDGRAWKRSAAVAAALELGCMGWVRQLKGMEEELVAAVWECTCWNTWVIAEHEEKPGSQEVACACAGWHKQRWQQIEPVVADAAVVVQPGHAAWTEPRLAAVVEGQGQVSEKMMV